MGQMKKIYTELQERGLTDDEMADLDFDLRDADDIGWWREQDAELEREEMQAIENQADIEAERMGGWL